MAVNDTCYYAIQQQSGGQWEVGIGTYTSANTITRTTVISSSNSNLAVTFTAGVKDVFITMPATRAITNSGLTQATARLLGRASASTGAVEEITLGTNLSFSGTTLNATSSSGGTVNVMDFDADATGVADSRLAFQNAIDSLGARGGVVIVPPGTFYIGSSLSVGDSASPFTGAMVTLRGCYGQPGQWNNTSGVPAPSAVSSIRLAAGSTIRLMAGCGVEGCFIYKNGFAFTTGTPSFGTFTRVAPTPAGGGSTDAGSACRTAALANTAFWVEYSPDAFIRNCMIIGFGLAVWASNSGRFRMDNVNIDCQNGIWMDYSADITYLTRVHCWPFSNYIAGTTVSPTSTTLQRTGSAFYVTRVGDWTKITDCFSYGYSRGFEFAGGDEVVLNGCGADQTPNTHTGSMGFLVDAGATNIVMTNCQSAGQQNGFYIQPGAGAGVRMVNCETWGCTDNGVAVLSGTVAIFGGAHRTSKTGLNNAGGTVYASGVGFKGNTVVNTSGTISAMTSTYTF
jgi:hypothetical protein